ncbi:MAG TPA: tetratricopeptide repeat protein [Rudaea sp.]|nr:tetratricopeptide repeat protein [Rudaea sp.]
MRELFERALEQPAAQREAWLDQNVTDAHERQTLQRLLRADDDRGFLDTPAVEHVARLSAQDLPADGLIGQRIGAFRIVRRLGQGGMAVVFLGERADCDFSQHVAIKLLRRGLYSQLEQRLFTRERQVLARLQHPNIARLIDGAVTAAGIPYLVMEFVDGLPITQHAEQARLNLPQRLRLFVEVCRAVEAAHRSLIVHRDIKPSNILVGADGQPKLLDFGIAKLLEEDTRSVTVGVYTPEYAAPEQVRGGAITTATDVFGLGVLLHELLLGLRPAGTPTRRPSTRTNELPKPSSDKKVPDSAPAQLRKQLRGDLDNIVLKSLDADPARRYASAGAFADDIERFLQRQPVSAHPPSRLYRTKKFIQRHRGGVAVTAAFVLAILASLGMAVWQANVARHEAARANTVRDFLLGVFDAARAHLPRDQRATPEILVEQARLRLATTPNLDAATRADVLCTLGEVALSQDNFARAQALFADAQTRLANIGDQRGADAALVMQTDALQRAGANAEAVAKLTARLPALRAAPRPALLRALGVLAAAQMQLGKPDMAIAYRREAVAAANQLHASNSLEALGVALDVGNTLAQAQRYPDAVRELEPLLARWRALHAPQDDRYVAALESFATATDGVGNLDAAQARFSELLALKKKIYTAPHHEIARTLRDLGQVVARAEKYAQAQTLLDQALAMDRQVFGDSHQEIAADYNALGTVMIEQQDFSRADSDYRAAIAVCSKAAIKDEVCPRAHNNLGMSLYRQNRLDEARAEMEQALAQRRTLFGSRHPTVAYSLSTLANVAAKQGKSDEALRLAAEALSILEHDGLDASREAALIRNGYAQSLWLAGRNDDALREIDRTLVDWKRVAPQSKARRVAMLVLKAQILLDLKQTDAAHRSANDAIALGVDPSELSPQTKALLHDLGGQYAAHADSDAVH